MKPWRMACCFLCLWTTLACQAHAEEEILERISQRGPVTARVRLTPPTPRLGDDLTLTLEVEAQQGVSLLMPEFGQSLDRFAILEYLPGETIDPQGQTRLTQRYTLQPPLSGAQSIPPLSIEFVDRRPGHPPAPKGEDAYELLTERLSFQVASVIPEGAAMDLKPPMGPLQPLGSTAASAWWWLMVIPLLLATPLGWRAWVTWRGNVRQRTAFDIAHGRLQAMMARPRPGPEAMDAFFVELSDIIRHYLENRFCLRAPERTTEEFLDIASGSPDLTAEHRGFLYQFLSYADRVKFARHLPQTEQLEQTLTAALHFLQQTREETPHA